MEKKGPKISIVTISYNCESEIEDTIKSVIGQPYDNKEYIIVDGASKDGTMRVVDRYRDKIDIIISEPDKGRSDAFNKGIKHATGDYIVMMNAGDLLAEDALNKFARSYTPGCDVIKGNTIRWDVASGAKYRERPVVKYPSIPFNFLVCHQSTYISRQAYEKYGGYETQMHIAMDFELMLRLTLGGATFQAIDEDLALFRMGGISQMSGKKRLDEMVYAMRKNGRTALQCSLFLQYLRVRTRVRDLLNKISPNIKNYLISKM